MTRILHTIKVLSFWGVYFLVILTVGFKVNVQELIYITLQNERPFSLLSAYLLLSIVIFPIMFFITNRDSMFKYRFPFIVILSLELEPDLWVPYKGLDLRFFFHLKEYDSWKSIVSDIVLGIFRIIEMLLWWGILIFGTYFILNQPNMLRATLQSKSTSEKCIIICIAIFVYLLLNIVSRMINKIADRIMVSFELPKTSSKQSFQIHHSSRENKRIPSGCRACGGPYPECKTSCKLFDD